MNTWTRRWLTIGGCFLLLIATIAPTARAAPLQQATPQIEIANNPTYGTILVSSTGETLYILTAETNTVIKCADKCLTFWPPLTVPSASAAPSAAPGVSGQLGTVARPGSNPQITYDGYPVYMYYQDKAPGDTNGQGTQFAGGVYTVVHPNGVPLAATAVERLAVHITSSGSTVWGQVTVRYMYQHQQTQQVCGSANCQLIIPYGVMVHLSQRPENVATWRFAKWRIRSMEPQGMLRTTTRAIPSFRMSANYGVKAIYTPH